MLQKEVKFPLKQRFKSHDILRFYSRKVFPGKFWNFDQVCDQAPSKSMAYKWFKEFQFGSRSLEDRDHCRRLIPVTPDGNMNYVKTLIKENPRNHWGWDKGRFELFLGQFWQNFTVPSLCSEALCGWVPHQLTEEQKRARIELCLYKAGFPLQGLGSLILIWDRGNYWVA